MLIENVLDGNNVSYSIAGIGLNVNQREFPINLINPTSMSLASGKEYDLESEMEKLHVCLRDSIVSNLNADDHSSSYEGRLYRKGEFHEYVRCSDGTSFEAMITGVDKSGLLEVRNRKGEREKFAFKEISYII